MSTLNLGIVAHVDAGKTSLAERLLFAAGVIDDVGRVDDGNTQTDTLALERQRGITIKSAVVSFAVGGLTVNLIDTPGHPDFIAEVERTLAVLDGAVLVVSAVEGVQAQTRVLMRALRRLGLPTLVFVNKIDRAGARDEQVVAEIREKLTPDVVRWDRSRASAPAAPPSVPPARRRGLHHPAGGRPRRPRRRVPGRVPGRRDGHLLRAGCAPAWPPRSAAGACTRCSSARPPPAQASDR